MLPAISQYLLQDAFDTDAAVTTPLAFKGAGVVDSTHYIRWGDGVAAGVVEIEVAVDNTASTWAPVATVTFDGSVVPSPKTDYVRVQGAYGAFRHRISTIVEGGTVTTKIVGSA